MPSTTERMPVVFLSHGAPDILLRRDPSWTFMLKLGHILPRPRAVLCISAHWVTDHPCVGAVEKPRTIHDFFGFPARLNAINYPAPGNPALAQRVQELLGASDIETLLDSKRGLDHGAWSPLITMYPQADIPVVQLSLQVSMGAAHHLRMGEALRPLRNEGVLILGSGGATHNLAEFGRYPEEAPALPYADEFDQWLQGAVESGDRDALANYLVVAPLATRNHPTPEHYLPICVAAGAADEAEGRLLHNRMTFGVLSMAAYMWGELPSEPPA
jgi:4,5-DOPA dioxygenase extradiol